MTPASTDLPARDYAEALQTVADSVRIVAGFDVAAISVLRGDRRFEYVVASATHEDARAFLGKGNSLDIVEAQNRNAEQWGRFDFVPHDVQEQIEGEATWTPDVEYPDAEDAFHPDDLLSTLLRDEDGSIIGMLSLDVPVNGRRPDGAQLALMDAFADHTERVMRQVKAQQALTSRLRLANAARDIVRRASSSVTLDDVLSECLPALMTGFDLRGLWVQVFDGLDARDGRITTSRGVEVDVPPHLMRLAESAARATWEQQTVTVLSSKSALQFISEEDRAAVMTFLESVGIQSLLFAPLGAGDRALGNLVLTRSDSSTAWTKAERTTALEIGRDLGQALHNAQLFKRNQNLVNQLQDLNAYKRTLVDMMVHELKNPLTAITGYLEMARSDESLSPLATSALDAIDRSSERMLELVASLLTLSSVTESSSAASHGLVDLVPMLRRSIGFRQGRAEAKDLQLTLDTPESAMAWGDAEMLELVVSNLVSNAVKYTPAGGQIRASLIPGDDELVLRVCDTGLGIAPEDHDHIFEEFRRSSNPEAVAQPGTGLGLSIVKRVVEQHRGSIHLDSTLGVGSTFEVRLPVRELLQQ